MYTVLYHVLWFQQSTSQHATIKDQYFAWEGSAVDVNDA